MPVNAVHAGVVDFVLPPEKIPQKLLELNARIVVSDDGLNNISQKDEESYKQILSLLRTRRETILPIINKPRYPAASCAGWLLIKPKSLRLISIS